MSSDCHKFALPRLRARLLQRYQQVWIDVCERRVFENGREGFTVGFRAKHYSTLVELGLAERSGSYDLRVVKDFEVTGGGGIAKDESFIYWHCYDDEPHMRKGCTWPPKKTTLEVERIWKRMVRSANRAVARPKTPK